MATPDTGPAKPQQAASHAAIVARVSSRAALWVGAAWGFAEASLFFIVPDAWLGFVALFAPRRMLVTLAAIVAGAAAGAAALYLATPVWPDELGDLIVALPAIAPADLDMARARLQEGGASVILLELLEGRAVKLYVHAAASDGIGLLEVVAFTVLNRLARMLLFGTIMMALGWAGRSIVSRWPRGVAVLYAVGWVVFYGLYFVSHQA